MLILEREGANPLKHTLTNVTCYYIFVQSSDQAGHMQNHPDVLLTTLHLAVPTHPNSEYHKRVHPLKVSHYRKSRSYPADLLHTWTGIAFIWGKITQVPVPSSSRLHINGILVTIGQAKSGLMALLPEGDLFEEVIGFRISTVTRC